jgi:threonine synthase
MITLVKTVGGNNGTPKSCKCCGGSNFIKAGMAWSCGDCGLYFPAELKGAVHIRLQDSMRQLAALHNQLKHMLQELEDLVKE